MSSSDTTSKSEPSQVSGGLAQLQGTIESVSPTTREMQVYTCGMWAMYSNTIGNITGAESWKAAGEEHQLAGAEEVEEAQKKARKEAREERLQGKIDSAKGMLFGGKH
ncbi:hypothetical protein ABW20_dc0102133 [Dactylellina cionopaga]|nr:hypothetical protein ABW20_dc0102133 [Dactylellina cionopaga]